MGTFGPYLFPCFHPLLCLLAAQDRKLSVDEFAATHDCSHELRLHY